MDVSNAGAAPGWRTVRSRGGFDDIFGAILVRAEPDGRARCRVETGPAQANPGGTVHGGFLMAFADHVGLLGAAAIGRAPPEAVTIHAGVTFVAAGTPGTPIDALVEVIGETGRMLFVRGVFEQDGHTIGTFEATLRKRSAAPAGA